MIKAMTLHLEVAGDAARRVVADGGIHIVQSLIRGLQSKQLRDGVLKKVMTEQNIGLQRANCNEHVGLVSPSSLTTCRGSSG